MGEIIRVVITLSSLAIVTSLERPQPETPSLQQQLKSEYFRLGDPRLCMEISRDSNFPVHRFDVLPGAGWDNLQNEPRAQVIQFNYTKCLSTDDGRYLVPDEVFSVPMKMSSVDTFAELLETWHEATSTTANSINIKTEGRFGFTSVSGSYSQEHTEIKQKQIQDYAMTVRVQLRYERYKSMLQPDAPLHPAFKRRLLDMAAFLELNQTQMVQYEAQLLVRDFGTHVLSSVTAGAGLMKTDFVKRDYVASQKEDKTRILTSASASFGSFFSIKGTYGYSLDTGDYKTYLKSMTHSHITSHGGPLLRAYNMSINEWTDGVDIELVPMDRSGDPLSFLVTQENLKELPVDLVYDLEKTVRQAVVEYYDMNTIAGCTRLEAPNFSYSANFDDGSCEETGNDLTFGGVYQTCHVEGRVIYSNPCNGLQQVNPKTRDYKCSEHYTEVKLVTGRYVGQPQKHTHCRSCGWFGWSRCCDSNYYVAVGVYTAYWCAALGDVPRAAGYLFGGVYSSTQDNVITGTKGCPPTFYPRTFLDQQLCISDDFEMGTYHSIPFGGFSSCVMGNPLSVPNDDSQPGDSLKNFVADKSDPSAWPKHCPKGYSQHLATINGGCEIQYCLKSGALKGPTTPKIKLPPFQDKPNIEHDDNYRVVFNQDTGEWSKNERDYNMRYTSEQRAEKQPTWASLWGMNEESDDSQMAPEEAAAIAGVVTASCGVVAVVIFVIVRRMQRKRQKVNDSVVSLTDDTATKRPPGFSTSGPVSRNHSHMTCVEIPEKA